MIGLTQRVKNFLLDNIKGPSRSLTQLADNCAMAARIPKSDQEPDQVGWRASCNRQACWQTTGGNVDETT
ncbi:hypothetical protein ACC771_15825, partial [Rhizobium ruizarguesonis]